MILFDEDLYMDDYIEFEVPDGDGSHIVLYGSEGEITIENIHLYYREGDYYQIDDNGELYADWSLTLFYEDQDHPEEYFYLEQDPPETAIYNLKNILRECSIY